VLLHHQVVELISQREWQEDLTCSATPSHLKQLFKQYFLQFWKDSLELVSLTKWRTWKKQQWTQQLISISKSRKTYDQHHWNSITSSTWEMSPRLSKDCAW
jgi:hypothetical protein